MRLIVALFFFLGAAVLLIGEAIHELLNRKGK